MKNKYLFVWEEPFPLFGKTFPGPAPLINNTSQILCNYFQHTEGQLIDFHEPTR